MCLLQLLVAFCEFVGGCVVVMLVLSIVVGCVWLLSVFAVGRR